MRLYLPLLMVIALGGCTTVHVPEPFGDTPVALDPEEWNGTWCEPAVFKPVVGTNTVSFDPAGCVSATVADPDRGILDVVIPDDPQPQQCRLHLRQVGSQSNWIFVTVEEDGRYEFVERLAYGHDRVFTWELSRGIPEQIELGRLTGRVDGGRIYLEPLTATDVLRIAADEHGEFFHWADPRVLVRVDGGS